MTRERIIICRDCGVHERRFDSGMTRYCLRCALRRFREGRARSIEKARKQHVDL
jgi:hypothetical protein